MQNNCRYKYDEASKNYIVNAGDFKTIANIVNQYIKDFKNSSLLQQMVVGAAYYDQKNIEIFNAAKKFFSEEKNCTYDDPYRANNKLPSGFVKLQTKQKVGFLINDEMVIAGDGTDRIKSLKKRIKQCATEGSIKAKSYLMPLIKKDGDQEVLKFKLIPSEQIIIIPESDDPDSIKAYIRFYKDTVIDETGKSVELKRAEYWDEEFVWFFSMAGRSKKYSKCKYQPQNPKPHINQNIKYGSAITKMAPQVWGRPPICVLNNNDELRTDTYPIKRFVDAYDVMTSDFANNMEDFQDVFWILKNFGGEDYDEIIAQIKKERVVATGENADAKAETIDIPHEARSKILELLESLIWKFGMGLDYDGIEGAPTATQIRFMLANLTLKVNDFEIEINDLIDQMKYFINKFNEIEGITIDEKKELTIKFVRPKFEDVNARLKANSEQMGSIDEETRIRNHPWVNEENFEEVFARYLKEKGDISLSLPINEDDPDDEDDENDDE